MTIRTKSTIVLSIACLLGMPPCFAVVKPQPLATDARIKVVAYQTDNVVPLHIQTMNDTQIVFGKDETILDIDGGDLGMLTVSRPKGSQNYFYVKPNTFGYNAGLTVVTNTHTYYFHLVGNEDLVKKADDYTYAIKFMYPEDENKKIEEELALAKANKEALIGESKDPSSYNWNYSFNGSPQITPLHVYDDGKFTYMQLQPNQDVPAVFAVDNSKGEEAIVNFRKQGNYLIIERLAPQFTLRDGKYAVASIFNTNLIQKLRGYQGA